MIYSPSAEFHCKVTTAQAERCTTHHYGCDCWQYKYQNMEISLSSFRRKCDELKVENARLREALEDIATSKDLPNTLTTYSLQKFARAALSTQDPEKK